MNLLNNADFQAAAEQLGCDSATIQAVCLIEAPHGGFHPDGSLVTLFEGHIFIITHKANLPNLIPTYVTHTGRKHFMVTPGKLKKTDLIAPSNLIVLLP